MLNMIYRSQLKDLSAREIREIEEERHRRVKEMRLRREIQERTKSFETPRESPADRRQKHRYTSNNCLFFLSFEINSQDNDCPFVVPLLLPVFLVALFIYEICALFCSIALNVLSLTLLSTLGRKEL